MQENLFMYDSFFKSQFRSKSVSQKIFSAAEDALITYLKQQSWIMQKEMIWFLWKEWELNVHQFTISRILKRKRWSNKKKQHVSIRQNDELHLNWVVDLLQLMIEQLVFVRIMPRASHRDTGKRRVNQVNENSKLKSEIYRGAKTICTEERKALGSIEPRLASRTRVSVEDWARS